MAPVLFTLVLAKSHQPVQESPSVTIGSGRWDFPLSAQGNGVDISPAILTRDSSSLSINSSLVTMAVSHTHTEPDFVRGSLFLMLLEIWSGYTTSDPVQPVVPSQVCNSPTIAYPREPVQISG